MHSRAARPIASVFDCSASASIADATEAITPATASSSGPIFVPGSHVFSAKATQHDALLQPETRAAYRRILHQGWTDILRTLHPRDDRLFTFWDYTAGCWQRDAGFRIDHLLCSPEAVNRVRAAGVDKWARGEEKASDHAPTYILLD